MGKITKRHVKRCISTRSMTKGLQSEFISRGIELESVYARALQLFEENSNASPALMQHLEQILPCIAFYEKMLEIEESREVALEHFGKWSLKNADRMAQIIRSLLRFPGLYKKMPSIFDRMMDSMFGSKAGFVSRPVEGAPKFARDVTVCPYVEALTRYGCVEIAQFFCLSDDICYGNMHEKLVWKRTKTLGRGDDCCDFRLYIEE